MLRSKIVFVCVSLTITVKGGIDFTPGAGERILEGIRFPELYFHENGRKISYEQPRGWSYSGDAARIRLVPPNARLAFGEFTQAPLPKPQNFDEETVKALQGLARAGVPPDSEEVSVVSAEKNPIMINGHETFEVTVAYQLYSERYQQSVLFMNLADTQVVFRFASRKPDFEKLHRDFRSSLCSLQWH